MLNFYGNPIEYWALGLYIARIAIHIGIIVSVWRFRQEERRWRPGVGFIAMAVCGIQAYIIFDSFVQLQIKGFDMFNGGISFCMLCLYLYILACKGNIAPVARPLIIVSDFVKEQIYALKR